LQGKFLDEPRLLPSFDEPADTVDGRRVSQKTDLVDRSGAIAPDTRQTLHIVLDGQCNGRLGEDQDLLPSGLRDVGGILRDRGVSPQHLDEIERFRVFSTGVELRLQAIDQGVTGDLYLLHSTPSRSEERRVV